MMILLMSLNSFQSSSLSGEGGAVRVRVSVCVCVYLHAELSILVHFFDKRLKLGSPRDGQVECLGGEEGLQVKQVKVVVVY